MADVVVTIQVSDVSYTSWLRTSYVASSLVDGEGVPLILNNELGADQEDAFLNIMDEAVREVLKVYLSRQGDVIGVPFEYSGGTVVYRFKEEEPVLPQAVAIKSALDEDTKNAIFLYTTMLWYRMKGNVEQANSMLERYQKITMNINNHLYKLHD